MTGGSPLPPPPRLSRLLLRLVLHRNDTDCALSDLEEEFEQRCRRDGPRPAVRWYRSQARRSVWPAIQRRLDPFGRGPSAASAAPDLSRPTLAIQLASEWRWAWHAVRRRGRSVVLQAGLVGVTLAACALAFAATDALVWSPAPYPNANRLLVLQKPGPDQRPAEYIPVGEFNGWRSQSDIFASVQAHSTGPTLHLPIGGVTEQVRAHDITPGLLEALGVIPRWGRPFVADDAASGAEPVAIVSEHLARGLFGDASLAIDRTLDAGAESWRIVGVMPSGFHFPTATEQIWRPFVLPPAEGPGFRSVQSLALPVVGTSIERTGREMTARGAAIRSNLPPFLQGETVPIPLADARRDSRALLVTMLLGAAGCLLLIACLNVVGLELASAVRRTRAYAVRGALGATRATLVRTSLFEAAIVTAAAVSVGLIVTSWGGPVLSALLPEPMQARLVNPIDLDARSLWFVGALAVATWMLLAAPVVWRTARTRVAEGLSWNARTSTVSRAQALARHALMAAQVGLTVLLLVGSLLFVRSYSAHALRGKGFDSTSVATVEVLLPAQVARTARATQIESDVVARLQALPEVRSVSRTGPLLPSTSSGVGGALQVEGRPAPDAQVHVSGYPVDPEYFATLGMTLRSGRWLAHDDPPGAAVVDESFARRFWPEGDAVGARFSVGRTSSSGVSTFDVVGVASPVRGDRVETPAGVGVYVVYFRPVPSAPALPRFVVRLDDIRQLDAVTAAVRSVAGSDAVVRTTPMDERYAQLYGDTRMAAGITTIFAVVAFVVAIVGIYGVIAFLVVSRTREIGIRLAIGASTRRIQRLVLAPAFAFIVAGVVCGLAAARAAARAIESQLFGVTAADPGTYAVVTAAVVGTAVLATWLPARRAARIDPAITLRAE